MEDIKTEKYGYKDGKPKVQFITTQKIDPDSNGGYKHVLSDKVLYIAEGEVSIKLESADIMEMLEALGITGINDGL